MLDDVDATLKALLGAAAAPAELRAADVSFDSPDRDYKPTQSTVNLFLHDVVENVQLRDPVPFVAQAADGVSWTSSPPVLRLDCTYLVTAWSSQQAGLRVHEEHMLLGRAVAWLSHWPLISAPFLQGALAEPPQPYPLPSTVAQAKEGRQAGQFWTAMGIVPRPSFSLTVTVAVQSSDPVEDFPPVREVVPRTTFVTPKPDTVKRSPSNVRRGP